MENLTDTLLNICVFVFVGLLIWLYYKATPENDETQSRQNDKPQ